MTLDDLLTDLIVEFDRVHPNGQLNFDALDKQTLPTFVTAENGQERHFTRKSIDTLLALGHILYRDTKGISKTMRKDEYLALVRQAVADCHALGEFDLSKNSIRVSKSLLKKRIATSLVALQTAFTHYFPAWTLGVEDSQKFAVGPVTFLTRRQWLDSVRFSPKSLHAFSATRKDGAGWKQRVDALLSGKARPSKNSSLPDWIYRAVKDCPAVLKVNISGSERALSEQRARYACRTALDCVALLFRDAETHHQFVLGDERLAPTVRSSLIESNGRLWLPGSSFKPRGWMGNNADAVLAVTAPASKKILSACGKVIRALLNPASSKHPDLAQRWALALAVCAEGCREFHDGLALAKLASSLDILSGGGMEKGILGMLLHITKQKPTDVVAKLPEPLTFAKVVERIYKHGRSQFLHGNHVDAMMSFDFERAHATFLAKAALRSTVVSLSLYNGADTASAFRTM